MGLIGLKIRVLIMLLVVTEKDNFVMMESIIHPCLQQLGSFLKSNKGVDLEGGGEKELLGMKEILLEGESRAGK